MRFWDYNQGKDLKNELYSRSALPRKCKEIFNFLEATFKWKRTDRINLILYFI